MKLFEFSGKPLQERRKTIESTEKKEWYLIEGKSTAKTLRAICQAGMRKLLRWTMHSAGLSMLCLWVPWMGMHIFFECSIAHESWTECTGTGKNDAWYGNEGKNGKVLCAVPSAILSRFKPKPLLWKMPHSDEAEKECRKAAAKVLENRAKTSRFRPWKALINQGFPGTLFRR